jgi:hypothetical protein
MLTLGGGGNVELDAEIGVVEHVTDEKDEQESLTNAAVARGAQAG